MKTRDAYIAGFSDGSFNENLRMLYPKGNGDPKRYIELLKQLPQNDETFILSTPGRTELGGNHTDHNHGRVLAGSVDLDSICVAQRRPDSMTVELHSQGYPEPFIIDLEDLEVNSAEFGKTDGVIRGVAAGLVRRGYRIGGFVAYMQSNVLRGSGLSSSASIEVLMGSVFNHLYNEGSIDSVFLAKNGQYAENVFFGKPCGLMDQMACAVGGVISIDFEDPEEPLIEKIDSDFSGYSLMVVDTGGNHADLTPEYASVPEEMKAVAALLGRSVCRGLSIDDLLVNYAKIHETVGDRGFLRAYHFITENQRVLEMVDALRAKNIEDYLRLVQESGNSSFRFLQNCYSSQEIREQGIPVALGISEMLLKAGGASRVHGGGFAGTIQAYVPESQVGEYQAQMQKAFGEASLTPLSIRQIGTYCF